MVLVKIFNTISSYKLALESQKLATRILFQYLIRLHYNRGIVYDEMVLILVTHTVAKPHVKR